jgi:hypothetical protein
MRTASLVVVALLAGLGACSSDDDNQSATADPTTASSPTASSPTASASASGPAMIEGKQLLWPRPDDTLDRTDDAGLTAEEREHLTYHVHAHLDIFVDGQPVVVPAGIGINIADPGVKTFTDGGQTGYGRIDGCGQPCISPLHTHDPDGILHTEAEGNRPNTLGQFFTEWGITLSSDCIADRCGGVKAYVDGQEFTGDLSSIELTDRREIALVVGAPPADIPSSADFSFA